MSSAAEKPLVIDVRELTAGYLPGVDILNDCSLNAAQGELIGIIGPNGAGKSTLLKAIFGQVKIRSGEILLNGENITGLKANKLVARGVGMVPQNNNIFPSLSIEENLEKGLYQNPKIYKQRLEFVTVVTHPPVPVPAPVAQQVVLVVRIRVVIGGRAIALLVVDAEVGIVAIAGPPPSGCQVDLDFLGGVGAAVDIQGGRKLSC